MDVDTLPKQERSLRLLAVRTIDPPSRLTPPGVPNFLNTATGGLQPSPQVGVPKLASTPRTDESTEGVWSPPVGGAKRATTAAMVRKALERGGVAEEVLDGLDGVD